MTPGPVAKQQETSAFFPIRTAKSQALTMTLARACHCLPLLLLCGCPWIEASTGMISERGRQSQVGSAAHSAWQQYGANCTHTELSPRGLLSSYWFKLFGQHRPCFLQALRAPQEEPLEQLQQRAAAQELHRHRHAQDLKQHPEWKRFEQFQHAHKVGYLLFALASPFSATPQGSRCYSI